MFSHTGNILEVSEKIYKRTPTMTIYKIIDYSPSYIIHNLQIAEYV